MGPQHGIVNQGDSFTEMPQTQVDDLALEQVRNLAKYSATREYKQLKAYLEERIEFYRTYLPDGTDPRNKEDLEELGKKWLIASSIISELQQIITAYENARAAAKQMN